MTQICGKWLKYVGKLLNYLTKGLKMWNMTQRFMKWQNIWEMAQMHGSRIKYLRNGFTILEMAYEFDKRLKYVENDVYMWERA